MCMELIDLVKKITSYSEIGVLNVLETIIEAKYGKDKVTKTNDFLVAEGNIPVALVAHADTVFSIPPKLFFHDKEEDVLWSPQGLGADDRAGIAAILSIISEGLFPHLIITTKEEMGGLGAQMLIRQFPQCPFKELHYIVELDRRGYNDCVFYECENPKFIKYVESFGFSFNIGSFTDISIICPLWGVAGVNLSVGYEEEHSKGEYLNLTYLTHTIQKVKKMLKQADRSKIFKYIKSNKSFYGYYGKGYAYDDGMPCDNCGEMIDFYDCINIRTPNNGLKMVCLHCFSKMRDISLCKTCGDWFITKNPNAIECESCKTKAQKGVKNKHVL